MRARSEQTAEWTSEGERKLRHYGAGVWETEATLRKKGRHIWYAQRGRFSSSGVAPQEFCFIPVPVLIGFSYRTGQVFLFCNYFLEDTHYV